MKSENKPRIEGPGPPDGYAYRYPDGCVRFNNAEKVNGCEPTGSIPYYFGKPAPEAGVEQIAREIAELAHEVEDLVRDRPDEAVHEDLRKMIRAWASQAVFSPLVSPIKGPYGIPLHEWYAGQIANQCFTEDEDSVYFNGKRAEELLQEFAKAILQAQSLPQPQVDAETLAKGFYESYCSIVETIETRLRTGTLGETWPAIKGVELNDWAERFTRKLAALESAPKAGTQEPGGGK